MILRASARATQLLGEIAGGEARRQTRSSPELCRRRLPDFALRYARCERLLGALGVSPAEVDRILEGFGLEKLGGTAEQATWKIPSYRSDLRREVDLIEEVVRVFGISRIAGSKRSCFTADFRGGSPLRFRGEAAAAPGRARFFRSAHFGAGRPRFVRQRALRSEAVSLRNPLSEDHVALRPSLVPGLFGALERNLRAGAKSVRLFEIGRAFLAARCGAKMRRLALLLSRANGKPGELARVGRRARSISTISRARSRRSGSGPLRWARIGNPNFALAAADFFRRPICSEWAGQLASDARRAAHSSGFCRRDAICLTNSKSPGAPRRFQELQRFPSVTRDIALLAPAGAHARGNSRA